MQVLIFDCSNYRESEQWVQALQGQGGRALSGKVEQVMKANWAEQEVAKGAELLLCWVTAHL